METDKAVPAASQRVLDVLRPDGVVWVDGERVTGGELDTMGDTLGWARGWRDSRRATVSALLAVLCERAHGDALLTYDGSPSRDGDQWVAHVVVADGDGERSVCVRCPDDAVAVLAGEVMR